jgi:hypothetical protein
LNDAFIVGKCSSPSQSSTNKLWTSSWFGYLAASTRNRLGARCEYELDAMHELSDQIRRQPVSHPEFQAQFRQQAALPGTDVSINADDVLHRRIHLPVLAARGESPGQQQGLVLGFLERMNERPHPGHGRIKFTLAVMFFGVAHGREQLLQLLVFHGGQMPVGIHRQNQQIEQGLLLGARQISQINFHGKSLPEVEADFNRRRARKTRPSARLKSRKVMQQNLKWKIRTIRVHPWLKRRGCGLENRQCPETPFAATYGVSRI